MSHFENIPITRGEMGKYRHTSANGNDVTAKVWYDDNGNIKEEETYSKRELERLAKNKKKKKEKEDDDDDDDCCSGTCCKAICIPFKILWWVAKIVICLITVGAIDIKPKD